MTPTSAVLPFSIPAKFGEIGVAFYDVLNVFETCTRDLFAANVPERSRCETFLTLMQEKSGMCKHRASN